ncbi:RNA 2'-phosphotransferase [Actinophytocola sp.]|uniref:RNA 2'-phosphotransferase n=1 Tax=Actinophytocola sp. TaxID=1872138 RepID=UPI002D7FEB78|nr:RNA 2'-phosphotransferase [Actinophytocola sp.]HET9141037.1 RNA 2'-phosphotransferase [Actinophytocola sp.]
MASERVVRVSKYLSQHLRHRPDRIGLTLDEGGWVDVSVLLAACAAAGFPVTRAELEHVVAVNDKQRFGFDESGTRIRANQGHTVPIDLGLADVAPPSVLYHGTYEQAVPSIRDGGLSPMARHDVHLSADIETARRVGARRGRPVILTVDAARMSAAGHAFRRSANGVWLTATVPPDFITFPSTASRPGARPVRPRRCVRRPRGT